MAANSNLLHSPISTPEFLALCADFQLPAKLACACSGGVDSMALAYLAAKSYDVTALIIDHGIREESAEEAHKSAEILSDLGITSHIITIDKEFGSNLQAEARKLRYQLMTDYCKAHNITHLATAHHADDNAETVLLKLARGSGVDGLSGIRAQTEINGIQIIRPLLPITKSRLISTLEEVNISWMEDASNHTDKYARNKLRMALAGLEDAELITSRINDMAENMRRVRDYLEMQTEQAYAECVEEGDNHLILDRDKFNSLHDEIAFRLLITLIDKLAKPEYRPRFEKLKKLRSSILNGEKKTLANLIFTPKRGKVIITVEK
ncbi:MAG: tRNA lysidine(34) synthetase TilS [Alphaproteobacteria bacterium CG11_big_fil_rev_8_21_14_0_20_44_7]|nr:MAG: tRNA lysidine(34) synthetase TilS [Alphaproteobacteria bacterium CG11_big_fil_rev_8_21_14_0_20_44_7]